MAEALIICTITLLIVVGFPLLIATQLYRKIVKPFSQPIVVAVQDRFDHAVAEHERKYNDLPELGKARVDNRFAHRYKWVTLGGALGISALAFTILGPIGIVPSAIVLRHAQSKWGEANDEIKSAEERKLKALNS